MSTDKLGRLGLRTQLTPFDAVCDCCILFSTAAIKKLFLWMHVCFIRITAFATKTERKPNKTQQKESPALNKRTVSLTRWFQVSGREVSSLHRRATFGERIHWIICLFWYPKMFFFLVIILGREVNSNHFISYFVWYTCVFTCYSGMLSLPFIFGVYKFILKFSAENHES